MPAKDLYHEVVKTALIIPSRSQYRSRLKRYPNPSLASIQAEAIVSGFWGRSAIDRSPYHIAVQGLLMEIALITPHPTYNTL